MTSKYDKVTANREKLALASFQLSDLPTGSIPGQGEWRGSQAYAMSVPQHPPCLLLLQELQLFSSIAF